MIKKLIGGILLFLVATSINAEISLGSFQSSQTLEKEELSLSGLTLESYTSILGDIVSIIAKSSGLSVSDSGDVEIASEEASLVGDALVFPNPCSFVSDTPKIGFRLNQDMTIEIRIYTLQGHQVGRRVYESGDEEGGLAGYNRVSVLEILDNTFLPAGSYIYILIYENKIIEKEIMAVKP